jgi:hypothetical protein
MREQSRSKRGGTVTYEGDYNEPWRGRRLKPMSTREHAEFTADSYASCASRATEAAWRTNAARDHNSALQAQMSAAEAFSKIDQLKAQSHDRAAGLHALRLNEIELGMK